jgi:hypothetical protein
MQPFCYLATSSELQLHPQSDSALHFVFSTITYLWFHKRIHTDLLQGIIKNKLHKKYLTLVT